MINIAYVIPGFFVAFLLGVIVGVKREHKNTDRVFIAWQKSNDMWAEAMDRLNKELEHIVRKLREKNGD